jgi:hypothetical protein
VSKEMVPPAKDLVEKFDGVPAWKVAATKIMLNA